MTEQLITKIKDQTKRDLLVFNSFPGILQKTEKDGVFDDFVRKIQVTIRRELDFAIKGVFKRAGQVSFY